MRSRLWLRASPLIAMLGAATAIASGCGEMPASNCREFTGTMALSPDGHTLAVAAPDPEWLHLFLVDLKSHDVQRLTDARCDAYPAWSPDGRTVARIYQDSEIDLVARGSRAREDVSGSFLARNNLQWTATGQLVYGIEDKDGMVGDLSYYVGSLPSTGGKATHPIAHARYPALSPDGRQIAYVSDDTDDMYIARYPRGARRLVLHGDGMTNLAWSPDRRWIAYNASGGLHLLATEGHATRELIESSGYDTPVWLPDSRHLLYGDSEQIFETSIDRDTGRPVVDLSTLRAQAR